MTPKEINDLYNNCESLAEIQSVLLSEWPKIYKLLEEAEQVAYGLEMALNGGYDDKAMYAMAVSLINYKKALRELECKS